MVIRQYYPLPPGNYVSGPDDYGVRLSANLRRLRESGMHHELPYTGATTQSMSVGGFLRDSPLDAAPRRSPHGTRELDEVEPLSHPATARLRSPSGSIHRSRSLTLPPKSSKNARDFASDDYEDGYEQEDEEEREKPLVSPANDSQLLRPASNPIHIGTSLPRSALRDSGPVFPMTDGAIAEFAALASTPVSNPSLFV